jgi:hypothetical protein
MKKWSVREKRDCMTNKIMYIRILFEQLFLKKKRKVEMRNKRTIDLSSFAFVSFLFFYFPKKKRTKYTNYQRSDSSYINV